MDPSTEIAQLKSRVAELELLLQKQNNEDTTVRPKISQMSAEVVDSNPYRYFTQHYI